MAFLRTPHSNCEPLTNRRTRIHHKVDGTQLNVEHRHNIRLLILDKRLADKRLNERPQRRKLKLGLSAWVRAV